MCEPRAEVVAFVRDKDLRLVLQSAERRGVDDSVAITLVRRALVDLVRQQSPSRRARTLSPRCHDRVEACGVKQDRLGIAFSHERRSNTSRM